MTTFIIWIAIAIVALIILLWFFPVALWFQALLSGVRVSCCNSCSCGGGM